MYATTFQEQREVVERECQDGMELTIVFRLVEQWKDEYATNERWQAECYFDWSTEDNPIQSRPLGVIAFVNHKKRHLMGESEPKVSTHVRQVFCNAENFESNRDFANMLNEFMDGLAIRWPRVVFETPNDPLVNAINRAIAPVETCDC